MLKFKTKQQQTNKEKQQKNSFTKKTLNVYNKTNKQTNKEISIGKNLIIVATEVRRSWIQDQK